jgi:hypothetical protein
MGDLFFLVKVTVVTLFVVLLMQVKIGESTLEERSRAWVATSPMVGVLQEVADGAVLLLAEGYQKVSQTMTDRFSGKVNKEDQPGYRTLKLQVERSRAVLERQVEKAKAHLTDMDSQTASEAVSMPESKAGH